MLSDARSYRVPTLQYLWQLFCAALLIVVVTLLGSLAFFGLLHVTGLTPSSGAAIGVMLITCVSLLAFASGRIALTRELRFVALDDSCCTLGFLLGSNRHPLSSISTIFVGPPNESPGALRRVVLVFNSTRQHPIWIREATLAEFLEQVARGTGRSILVPDPSYEPALAQQDPHLSPHLSNALDPSAQFALYRSLSRKVWLARCVALFLVLFVACGVYALVSQGLSIGQWLQLYAYATGCLGAIGASRHYAARARLLQQEIRSHTNG